MYSVLNKIFGKIMRLARSFRADQARPDDVWAHFYLQTLEFKFYQTIDPRDREHGLRVAQTLLERHPNAREELIAAAILHDCGKSVRPYHVLERVLVGLIPYGSSYGKGAGWRFEPIRVRNQHPHIGAELLRTCGGRLEVARLIEAHHHPNGDEEAELLHFFDHLE
jgi:putative nucleotidyltransferase with HDIG domain